MTASKRGLLLVTVAGFCIAVFGADAAARIASLDLSFNEAVFAVLTRPAGGWPPLFLSALPFAGAFEVAKNISEEKGNKWAVIFLIVIIAILWAVYFDGYLSYQDALRLQKSTDAGVGIGLLFLKGFAVVLVPMAIFGRRRRAQGPT